MTWQIELQARVGEFPLDIEFGSDAMTVALIGPNGSGKTSVLRLIAGAQSSTVGEVRVGGESIISTTQAYHPPMEERRVGYLPQGYRLFPHLTAQDNVAFGLRVGREKCSKAEARTRALQLMTQLNSEGLADRMPEELSGGEQQRVALARALLVSPQALLLDEPLSALDVTARRSVRKMLARHVLDSEIPTLMVTHDVRDVIALEATCCVLDQGRVVQQGSLDDLAKSPVNAFVAEFLEAGGVSLMRGASNNSTPSGEDPL